MGKRHFTPFVFATYTYTRDISVDSCWQRAGNDFNRYVQRLRRLHSLPIQYIRAIELHKDGNYPHIHAILRFPRILTITRARYFDKLLYGKWKQLWTSGLSDYQPPLSKRSPILYLIKYISKETSTYRTLWKHYYTQYNATSVKEKPTSSSIDSPKTESTSTPTVSPVILYCKKYKVKQLSWSRNFWQT